MPLLNARGQIGAGLGGGTVSIDRTPIASPAGGASWVDANHMAYQVCDPICRVEAYDQTTGRKAMIFTHGANTVMAGGGMVAVWFGATDPAVAGLSTSTGLRFPQAGLLGVSSDGALVYKPDYQSGGPTVVLEANGEEWTLTAGHAADAHAIGQKRIIWREDFQVLTHNLPRPIIIDQAKGVWRPRAVYVGGEWWIAYFSGACSGIVCHPFTSTKGYQVYSGDQGFGHDVVALDDATIRLCWASSEGEQPQDIRTAEINVKTAARVELRPSMPPDPPNPPVVPPAPSITIASYEPREGDVPLAVTAVAQILSNSGPINTLAWSYSPNNGATWIPDGSSPPTVRDHVFGFSEPGSYLIRLRALGPGGDNETGKRREVRATRVIEPPPPLGKGFTLRRHDFSDGFLAPDPQKFLQKSSHGAAFDYLPETKGLTCHDLYVAAENDKRCKADRPNVGSSWEEWHEEPGQVEKSVAYKSLRFNRYLSMSDAGDVRCNQAAIGGWESFIKEKVPVTPPPQMAQRPLVGPLKQIGQVYGDDTGYRRVLFYSLFAAPRLMVDDMASFQAALDLIAKWYQGIRVFISVGGYGDYWGGREVVIYAFTNDIGQRIEVNFTEDQWRLFLRECTKRHLRLHVTTGDAQIIFKNNPQAEVETLRRYARVAQEEGGWEVIAVWEAHNEYWQNSIYGDSPEEDAQDQKILDAVRAELPGVLTMRGSLNSEEPEVLIRSAKCGPCCAIHQTRQPPDKAIKRTFGLEHWEGNPKSFQAPNHLQPFWFGEPGGWNESAPRDDVYAPMPTKDWTVALYAMMTCTGYAVDYFDGISVRTREPVGSMQWGFVEIPQILNEVPEDIGSWSGSNGPGGAIWYWHSGNRFASTTIEGWNATPPRRVSTWKIIGADSRLEGSGHEAYLAALASLGSSFGGRLLVGTFE